MKPKTKLSKYKESDFHFLVKVALYLVLGSVWVVLKGVRIIPAGVIIGFIFSKSEFLQINRKIEYVMLLVGALFGLFGRGIYIYLNLKIF